MKIIALGDTHGLGKWKKAVADHPDADKIVFLGDYMDSYDIPFIEQLQNFREILHFKQTHPDIVELLLGNHDFHYMPITVQVGEYYTGYQGAKGYEISYVFQEHKDLFKAAWQWENHLFTHAGVTKTWFAASMGLPSDARVELSEGFNMAEYVNDVFQYTPRLFFINGRGGYGEEVTNSPFWIRPQKLNEDATDYIHIVGHTRQSAIGIEPTKFLYQGSGFFIDTMPVDQYLIIENGGYSIGRI